ncbi:MAG: formate dehydrogenase accessory sulfurtransferase FdhD [Dehalococcoidia bacterium]|nr:MAG: formate dehydrogenase accessory sulfurtransferase FdhD [Dehalococcoidia bacterium]
MADEIERLPLLRLTAESRSSIKDIVVREFPLTVILNNQEVVTLLCSPANLEYLALGFLFSEGLLKNKEEIKKIIVDDKRGVVRVETRESRELAQDVLFKRLITSGCGRGASFYNAADAAGQKVESKLQISAGAIFALVSDFQHRSQVYKTTGGVHSAALCDREKILVFSEDIGRHNAIDKIFGECLLQDIATKNRIIITSGRISSEILLKVAKRNIPLLISKSAPTNLGVKLASELGVTLVGFARGRRMNVYTHDRRVVTGGK